MAGLDQATPLKLRVPLSTQQDGDVRDPQPRAARRSGQDLEEALAAVHETVRCLENDEFYVTAIFARWRAATATVTWVNCGHPPAFLVDSEGALAELGGPEHSPLGTPDAPRSFQVTKRQLHPGERLILVTDGVINRRLEIGGTFGVDGLRRALERAESPTAASTATTIQQAVTDCWAEPLEDDATTVVMTVE